MNMFNKFTVKPDDTFDRGPVIYSNNVGVSYNMHNYTMRPIWAVDPFNQIIEILPDPYMEQMLAQGYNNANDPRYHMVGCIVVHSNLVKKEFHQQEPTYGGLRIQVPKQPPTQWCHLSEVINWAFFVDRNEAEKFCLQHKSVGGYKWDTSFGMEARNKLMTTLTNCTGMTLYVMDDNDIYELPHGGEETEHTGVKPPPGIQHYIRFNRYSGIKRDPDCEIGYADSIQTEMYEPTLDKVEDFMCIEQYNLILFKDIEQAVKFQKKYRSVSAYRRARFMQEARAYMEAFKEDVQRETERRTQRYVLGVGTQMATVLLGLASTALTTYLTINATKQTSTPPPTSVV